MRSPDYYAKLEAMKALAEMEESQDADAKASRQKMTSISREVQLLGNEARKRTLFWDNAVKLYARCGLS